LYPSNSVAQNNVSFIFTVSVQICALVLAVGAVQSGIVWCEDEVEPSYFVDKHPPLEKDPDPDGCQSNIRASCFWQMEQLCCLATGYCFP